MMKWWIFSILVLSVYHLDEVSGRVAFPWSHRYFTTSNQNYENNVPYFVLGTDSDYFPLRYSYNMPPPSVPFLMGGEVRFQRPLLHYLSLRPNSEKENEVFQPFMPVSSTPEPNVQNPVEEDEYNRCVATLTLLKSFRHDPNYMQNELVKCREYLRKWSNSGETVATAEKADVTPSPIIRPSSTPSIENVDLTIENEIETDEDVDIAPSSVSSSTEKLSPEREIATAEGRSTENPPVLCATCVIFPEPIFSTASSSTTEKNSKSDGVELALDTGFTSTESVTGEERPKKRERNVPEKIEFMAHCAIRHREMFDFDFNNALEKCNQLYALVIGSSSSTTTEVAENSDEQTSVPVTTVDEISAESEQSGDDDLERCIQSTFAAYSLDHDAKNMYNKFQKCVKMYLQTPTLATESMTTAENRDTVTSSTSSYIDEEFITSQSTNTFSEPSVTEETVKESKSEDIE